MKLPDIFLPEKNLENEIKRLLKDPTKAKPRYSNLKIVHDDTYAKSIAELKKQGQKPFTFFENIEARIADYEVNGENAELFDTWLDSVTGIAYKAHSTKFKLILRSDKLENIKPGFNQSFIPVNYNVENGVELDRKKGRYNQPLTREEAKNHEFWLVAMGGDKEKLAQYVDLWFDKTGTKKGMNIYLRSSTSQDELRALVLYDGDDSLAFGDLDLLSDSARFVSGA